MKIGKNGQNAPSHQENKNTIEKLTKWVKVSTFYCFQERHNCKSNIWVTKIQNFEFTTSHVPMRSWINHRFLGFKALVWDGCSIYSSRVCLEAYQRVTWMAWKHQSAEKTVQMGGENSWITKKQNGGLFSVKPCEPCSDWLIGTTYWNMVQWQGKTQP